MSNSLNTDQDPHTVGPDLCPNCLQRLSAKDDKSTHYYMYEVPGEMVHSAFCGLCTLYFLSMQTLVTEKE